MRICAGYRFEDNNLNIIIVEFENRVVTINFDGEIICSVSNFSTIKFDEVVSKYKKFCALKFVD